jgi:predicted nucleic acid-binding protein
MILYLETSALVKLYVSEPGTDHVRKQVEEAAVVAVSIIAYAEVRAAFARKFREKGISEKSYQSVKVDFERDWENVFILNATETVVKSAGDLAEKHGLRGLDALHLASALLLKKAAISGVAFSSADQKLEEAALREGFQVP